MSTFITTLLLLVAFSDKPPAVIEFENRIKTYVDLRQRIDSGFPETKESSNVALILKRKEQFGKALREARSTAKQGDIFIPGIRPILRKVIKSATAGPGGAKARSMILGEGNPKAKGSEAVLVLKVNAAYPSAAPVSTVPPSILLALPQLPEELEYRFVGHHLILRDVRAEVIVDFMLNAVPAAAKKGGKRND